MKIRETVENARENAARRMTESKLDRVAEENQELKTETGCSPRAAPSGSTCWTCSTG
jgi:hypothetical protein